MPESKNELFNEGELGLILRLLDDYKNDLVEVLENKALTSGPRNNAIDNQAVAFSCIRKLKKMLISINVDPQKYLYSEE
ncbi:MAG: hypothetical protein N2376_03165 [Clostridia bacterium]|nr:hypothetical protein [Clostridia bacterium]